MTTLKGLDGSADYVHLMTPERGGSERRIFEMLKNGGGEDLDLARKVVGELIETMIGRGAPEDFVEEFRVEVSKALPGVVDPC